VGYLRATEVVFVRGNEVKMRFLCLPLNLYFPAVTASTETRYATSLQICPHKKFNEVMRLVCVWYLRATEVVFVRGNEVKMRFLCLHKRPLINPEILKSLNH
jgi:hypothetical protein